MTIYTKPKAAFIDRDGVINEERHYVYRIEDFVILPRVVEGLALLRDFGYRLIVVTNQSGIARGYYDISDMHYLHEHLRTELAHYDILIDAFYFCPHHPQGSLKEFAIECYCRKPFPGMLMQAANDFNLEMTSSVLIGDKSSDLLAGKRAGVGFNVIVESGHKLEPESSLIADLVSIDLFAAAREITRK